MNCVCSESGTRKVDAAEVRIAFETVSRAAQNAVEALKLLQIAIMKESLILRGLADGDGNLPAELDDLLNDAYPATLVR